MTIAWEEEELKSGSPENKQSKNYLQNLVSSVREHQAKEVSESSLLMCARGSLEDGKFWKMEDSGRWKILNSLIF